MNIKPQYIYKSRSGNTVRRVGVGYTIHSLLGDYLGESLCMHDAVALADKPLDAPVITRPQYMIWNFADDEYVYAFHRYTWDSYEAAKQVLEEYIHDHNDLSTRMFYSDWLDVVTFDDYIDKFLEIRG